MGLMLPLNGFLNIDKPLGMTSHDVVYRVRRLVGKSTKVGHAGTLDPLATGVLIVCVGAATRLSDYAMHAQKNYLAQVMLGVETTTYDGEGEIIQQMDVSHLTEGDIQTALIPFIGKIQQIPPMYSAIKQGGKKLYDLARSGVTVEREPRNVEIFSLDLRVWEPPVATLQVVCSAGTYIRSLAHDLGSALQVGGSLSGLRRTASGIFTLENIEDLAGFHTMADVFSKLLPPLSVFTDWHQVVVTPEEIIMLQQGKLISIRDEQPLQEAVAVTEQNQLLAILQRQEDHWHPKKVFPFT